MAEYIAQMLIGVCLACAYMGTVALFWWTIRFIICVQDHAERELNPGSDAVIDLTEDLSHITYEMHVRR